METIPAAKPRSKVTGFYVADPEGRISLRPIPALLAGLFAANAAVAQDASTSSASDAPAPALEVIVVTAERHVARVQDTPISLNVVTAEALTRASVTNVADLNGLVPGLIVGDKSTGGGNQSISIRGVTGQTVLTGLDGAVGVYLDGVYLSKPDAAFFTLADVQRVEVLRGPQGTLYGRNATAGAINIITRMPDTKAWHGSVDANAGNYGSYTTRAFVGGPLGGGFAASLSMSASGNDGYFKNSANGRQANELDTATFRGKLHYKSEDRKFDATLSVDRTRESQDLAMFLFGIGAPGNFEYVGVSNPGSTFVDWDDYNFAERVSEGVGLTLKYRLTDDVTITSITGRRTMDVDSQYSFTPPGGFPALGGMGIQSINHSDYGPAVSQEFTATYQSDRLSLTGGYTYFTEEVSSQFGGVIAPLNSPPGDLNKVATAPIVDTKVKSSALFFQGDWEFIDNWTATLGLRANREQRRMFEIFPAVTGKPTLSSEVKDNKLLPKFGLAYRPNKRLMMYASRAEGYQAPGQSYSSSATGKILEVAPEKLISYEIGGKSEWLDGKLRINASAFHYDYDPLQVRVTTGLNQFKIVNAGAKVRGLELEVVAAVTRDLRINGNILSMNSRYTSFCDSAIPFDKTLDCVMAGTTGSNNGVSRVGDPLNQAPKLQGNVGFSYKTALSGGKVFMADGSYAYQSEIYFAPGRNQYARSGSIGRINLRTAVKFANDVEIYAYVNNLNDKQTQSTILYTALAGNVLSAGTVSPPRTFGLGARYSF